MQGEIFQVFFICLEFRIYALKFALTLFLVIHTESAYKDIKAIYTRKNKTRLS